MFNSIFRKQFILYLGTVLLTFAILAAVMSQALRSYFVSQKEDMLENQCRKIAASVTQYYWMGGGVFSTIALERLNSQILTIGEFLDISFIFIDTDYKINMVTYDIQNHFGATLSIPELKPAFEGKVVKLQGKLDNIFSTMMMTVAYPVAMQDSIIGVVILNSSMPELQKNISEVMGIMFMCLLASGVLAFALIYVSSRTISRPLMQMNEAAKIIASGNFERRLSMKQKDEIGELGQSFNNMAESLYQQDRQRQEFITNMSHDIRTPLTSMRGFIEAILDGTIPPEKHERYLKIVLTETDRLFKLANDVLELNKIQQQDMPLDIESFDINEIARATALMFETRARAKQISIILDLADKVNIVKADSEKITRVLFNLLDNALKFTPEGGRVTIKTVVSGDKIYTSVSDTGPGIGFDEQKWIFERFYKSDQSRSADKTGSGLGLAIVKAFIKAHNENITLESTPGKGSVFTFSLTGNDKSTMSS